MDSTNRSDEIQPEFKYYLPATPKTDGSQGPVERFLKAVFRRRGDRRIA